MDPCKVDLEEVRDVKKFSSTTCKCTKREGGPCSSYFSVEEFADHRMQMAELEHDALDIMILSQINAHHFLEDLWGHRNAGERKKDYTFLLPLSPYMFGKLLVSTWNRQKLFRNLVKHYKLNGVSAQMHGNHKHKPWNAAHFEDKERTVHFITNSKVQALPLVECHALRLTTLCFYVLK